jgi:hypothetical protein
MNPHAVAVSLVDVLRVDVMDTVAISRRTAPHVEVAEVGVLAQLGVGQVLSQEQIGPPFGRVTEARYDGKDPTKEAHTAARSTTLKVRDEKRLLRFAIELAQERARASISGQRDGAVAFAGQSAKARLCTSDCGCVVGIKLVTGVAARIHYDVGVHATSFNDAAARFARLA